MAAGTSWPAPHLLIVWRELSWRLGVCLQVVPDRAIDVIQQATDGLEDAVASAKTPTSELFSADGSWPADLSLSPSELRDDWIECMLSQLVSYRLRPDVEAFKRVKLQILAIGHLSQDQQSQICYQSCLGALSELDRDEAANLVTTWPTEPEDPYWLVRKAAILLELGDRYSATAAAIEGLERIRRRRRSDQTPFWSLSREGWCLRFLFQILHAKRFFERDDSVVEPIDIDARRDLLDRELEIARCSPDTELRLLEERISRRLPPAGLEYRSTYSRDFDTGSAQETLHLGADELGGRLAPAINILVACDHTGVPPSIGNFVFFREAGKSAMRWVRDELPGLWAAFALRFRGIGIEGHQDPSADLKQDAIRRTTLESLPLQHIERLFAAAMRELERIAQAAEVDRVPDEDGRRTDAIRSAGQFVDAVTRFSMCLDHGKREQVLVLALRISRIAMFRTSPVHRETIWRLVERVVPYLAIDVLNRWIFELLIQYPLACEETGPGVWPEITEFIPVQRGASLHRPESDEFRAGVTSLIELVSSTDSKTRTGAAWRLLGMYKHGLLSDTERQTFQQALWGIEDACGLPAIDDSYLAKVVHLRWPEERPGRRIEGLARWITSGEVKDRFDVKEATEGSGYSVTWPDPDRYLLNLRNLARRLLDEPEIHASLFNQDTRRYILNAILEWWERERDRFRYEVRSPRIFGGNVSERVDLALQVIFECTLGNGVPDTQSSERLRLFLKDVDGLDEASCYCHQVRAYLDVESVSEYWSEVRLGLWSNEPNLAYRALVSCWQWQEARERLNLSPMPRNVLELLLGAIGKFQDNLTYDAYGVVCRLLVGRGSGRRDFDGDLLLEAVQSAALNLRHDVHRDVRNPSTPADEELRPHLRRSLARLLVLLRQHDIPIGPTAENWLERARTDRFVDVRKEAESVGG